MDFQQGEIGDCSFLSSFGCVALQKRNLLSNLFVYPPGKAVSKDGRYVISLYDIVDGSWVDLEIDDYIPCRGGIPVFVTSVLKRELWPMLL